MKVERMDRFDEGIEMACAGPRGRRVVRNSQRRVLPCGEVTEKPEI